MKPETKRSLRRGVYVIPTSLTVLNIFFGFRCIVYSTRAMQSMTEGRPDLAVEAFEVACISLFLAALFDTFDGLIARALGAASEFGKEYDSLADVVTFGAAPAVLVYAWSLQRLGKLGFGIAFLFLIAVSLRLARFNTQVGVQDKRYFQGLAIPAGAGLAMSYVWFVTSQQWSGEYVQFVTPWLSIVVEGSSNRRTS